ncbi:MAG TPA: hypothetical protein DCE42_27590 [Myxococcales bacterium]|nr:hypothetical protein [Deltaproteobacteria bacterium]HAA58557.1 hypothetical protein [Myxococcales bacterium]|tara:strand:- start:15374 stop:17452 length:2079 start_codon:yes stop_codon:yes gene_type:complete
MSQANDEMRESLWRIVVDWLASTFFLATIGVLFVAFSVLLGKTELIALAYVMLAAVGVKAWLPEEWHPKLQKVALVGEGMKIFGRLEKHYYQHHPRSIFFYLFFPITGIWLFFFGGEEGRRELKAHFGLLQWIILLVVIEGFASYFRFSQHFSWGFALSWLMVELLSVYFLCNFFAVPVATTTLRLSLQEKKKRLMLTTLTGLVVLTASLFVFKRGRQFDNLLPISAIMDQRAKKLKAVSTFNKTSKQQAFARNSFFSRWQHVTTMFFKQYGPEMKAFYSRHWMERGTKAQTKYIRTLNKAYRRHIKAISPFGEDKHIYLTTNQNAREIWGYVTMPFRESLWAFFRWKDDKLTVYKKRSELPKDQQARLAKWWNTTLFRFSAEKRLMRTIVDVLTGFFQQSTPPPPMSQRIRSSSQPKIILPPTVLLKLPFTSASFSQFQRQHRARLTQLKARLQLFLNRLAKETELYIASDSDAFERLKKSRQHPNSWRFAGDGFVGSFLTRLPPDISNTVRSMERVLQKKERIAPNKLLTLPKQMERTAEKKLYVLKRRWWSYAKHAKRVSYHVELVLRRFDAYEKAFFAHLTQRKRQRNTFLVYHPALGSFHYAKALKAGLMFDHYGRAIALDGVWWATLYEWFLRFVLFFFQCMVPFHVAVILYCELTIESDDEEEEKPKGKKLDMPDEQVGFFGDMV